MTEAFRKVPWTKFLDQTDYKVCYELYIKPLSKAVDQILIYLRTVEIKNC